MTNRNKQVVAICLLWFRMASSNACSDKACSANELTQIDDVEMGQSDLSFVQVSAMEKRAQEVATSFGAQIEQSLDAAVRKKGEQWKEEREKVRAREVVDFNATTDLNATTDDNATTKKTSTDKASTEQASEDKASNDKSSDDTKKVDGPWSLIGDGCCEGKRVPENGKLFGLNVSDMDECKKKCRTFNNCGIIEYGWTEMPQWCYGWGTSQKCKKRDVDCVESVPGNGKGVQGWLFTAPKVDAEAAAKSKWEEIGAGCCAGAREESNGKIYANKEKSLDACKARCLTFDNCGIVEYGWTSGDPEWCYIWDDSQMCEKTDPKCKDSAMGNGQGARAYRLTK